VLPLTETKKTGTLRLDLPKKLYAVRKDKRGEARETPEIQEPLEVLLGGDEGELLVDIADAALT
jgi:hypothetical protein